MLNQTTYRRAASVATILVAAWCQVLPAAAEETDSPCGPLYPLLRYGPWDYRKDHDKLPIVLGAHFTPEVEALVRGRTTARPGGDIDYTLRAIPNNPRALIAMMNLGEKEHKDQVFGANYSVECYFERAIRFQPDDHIVRMIYATYLIKKNRTADASTQLGIVEGLATDNPFTYYNLGLLYFDLKNYDQALFYAHKAYAMGILHTNLRDELMKVGRWTEPAVAPAEAAASAPAASAPVASSSDPAGGTSP